MPLWWAIYQSDIRSTCPSAVGLAVHLFVDPSTLRLVRPAPLPSATSALNLRPWQSSCRSLSSLSFLLLFIQQNGCMSGRAVLGMA